MIGNLEKIAVEAGHEITRLSALGLNYEQKADNSKRSNADIASERIITSRLQALFPIISVIAEEAIDDGNQIPRLGNEFFLVDPLDGTRELEAGNGQFAVNIALIRNGRPVHGVMFAPAENRIYSSRDGVAGTALVSIAGQIGPFDSISCRPAQTASRGIVSRSRADDPNAYLSSQGITDIVRYGSTLKFCKVAEGYADIYVSTGATSEWDTAAGQAILEAAGGEVVELDTGSPLRYGKQDGEKPFSNVPFIARAKIK